MSMQLETVTGPVVGGAAVSEPPRSHVALILFLTLQVLDLATTLLVFSHGGIELNPVLSRLIPWLGQVPAIVVGKVTLISLVLLFSRRRWMLRFANVLYTGVVAWNVIILSALL